MSSPDLTRSEAFAEDLPDGGYEPLPLRPATQAALPHRAARGWLHRLSALIGARNAPPPGRGGTQAQPA